MVLGLRGRRQCPLYRPSVAQPHAKRGCLDALLARPLGDSLTPPIELQPDVLLRVVKLGLPISPAAILQRVALGAVLALDGMALTRASAHVAKERLEVLPFVADGDAGAAVAVVCRIVRVAATVTHRGPASVFWLLGVVVRAILGPVLLARLRVEVVHVGENGAALAASALAHQEVAKLGGVLAPAVAAHQYAGRSAVTRRLVGDQDTLSESGSNRRSCKVCHINKVRQLPCQFLSHPGENFGIAYRPGAMRDTRFAHPYRLDQGDEVRAILKLEQV